MVGNLSDLMKQAQQVQENLQKAQEDAAKAEVVGESGGGLVKVIMTGRHDVRKITIDDEMMSEDKAMLEDLVAAAVNDAVRKVEASNKDMMGKLTSGMGLPANFKMPF
ncbi:YbaB/EbfC family nucleoid-associated protein [Allohahella sp. A8]|jgi:nucleoid-associated protein EbfC|uniref:YbaB/EbfC family nucleoid-associated protein n=1 Tax=Allohahella sp. A8 TaxID=3141461 RepID=UPI000C09761F|nr:YbaB/EbfC family nucleoid-associated protein [Hahellaceae bacterium]|tara:strand:- start:1512 stop:1835 length:324 start_codon:yes stop_codon:yes gene_type:complete